MRIAVPAAGGEVCASLGASEEIRFYEDDHGRIVRQYAETVEGGGFDAALALLERHGADVLLCGAPSDEERRTLALSGLLIAAGASGAADDAVRAYLSIAIACDPSNTCNYCGHKDECILPHKTTT